MLCRQTAATLLLLPSSLGCYCTRKPEGRREAKLAVPSLLIPPGLGDTCQIGSFSQAQILDEQGL